METTAVVHTAPREVQDVIFRKAFFTPGIHFFGLEADYNFDFELLHGFYYAEAMRKVCPELRSPRPRPENNPLWWVLDELETLDFGTWHYLQNDLSNLPCARTTLFSSKNPSAYVTRSDLNAVFEQSSIETSCAITNASGWVKLNPMEIPSLDAKDSELKKAWPEDWLCDWQEVYEEDETKGTSEATDGIKEPEMWSRAWLKRHYRDWSKRLLEQQIMLPHRFPRLTELFFLDCAIRLMSGMEPSDKARRWRGGKYEFVDVLEGDNVWEREKDGHPGCLEEYEAAPAIADAKENYVLLRW
ncbi:hypothetical protein B0T14DRAFT_563609 [Immersiella caudata]|uniref:Uncharacterized protein n=1 Tax=Immersiella caudata TaxID=314043 RepID=A0AA39X644_9PEZI|nr:hypothetical protein B0T14DRAFT_563609 [Immersiella caudata]